MFIGLEDGFDLSVMNGGIDHGGGTIACARDNTVKTNKNEHMNKKCSFDVTQQIN